MPAQTLCRVNDEVSCIWGDEQPAEPAAQIPAQNGGENLVSLRTRTHGLLPCLEFIISIQSSVGDVCGPTLLLAGRCSYVVAAGMSAAG